MRPWRQRMSSSCSFQQVPLVLQSMKWNWKMFYCYLSVPLQVRPGDCVGWSLFIHEGRLAFLEEGDTSRVRLQNRWVRGSYVLSVLWHEDLMYHNRPTDGSSNQTSTLSLL